MAKDSFESCSNYFDRLRNKACEIDKGVDRLIETWKIPHLLIGGYAEPTAESSAYLEELWESIQFTHKAIEAVHSEMELSSKVIDQFLEESKSRYKDLKEQCDNLGIVLAEYGYHYEEAEEADSLQDNDHRDNSEEDKNSNFLNSREITDIEVEFTPDLTWKCKARSKELEITSANHSNQNIKSIATPVIKSLQSALHSVSPTLKEPFTKNIFVESNYLQHSIKVQRK